MEFLLLVTCIYSVIIICLVIFDRHDERKFKYDDVKTNKNEKQLKK